ncbi:hypothetical protein G7046_g2521 [Stylonectria norvegica]|nr:hypothetical protein G7046_g2521 [Stylonectria norvegica]
MASSSTVSDLPDIPSLNIVIPSRALASAAFSYAKEHTDVRTYNHVARSAYWALIIAQKVPPLAAANLDIVFISCILHDMGWATTKELLSEDKRFEVDGANIARGFLQERAKGGSTSDLDLSGWDEATIQRSWDSIALHATPSIAQHAAPEVALTSLGVFADFLGPNLVLAPGQPPVITIEEYRTVVGLFPREGFTWDGVKQILCGLCRTKPTTTYDNFVGTFGFKYGTDGKGTGKAEFAEGLEAGQPVNMMEQAMAGIAKIEESL